MNLHIELGLLPIWLIEFAKVLETFELEAPVKTSVALSNNPDFYNIETKTDFSET